MTLYFLVQIGDKENLTEKDWYEERILKINNYIRSNYAQNISLKELSEKLYLSIGYLSRFFKKNYGMGFVEYLTNIRLYHAVDDLLYTNISITHVAYNNGFTNAAVFNKAFKKAYGETPSAFRKRAIQGRTEEKVRYDKETEKRLLDIIGEEVIERKTESEIRKWTIDDFIHQPVNCNDSIFRKNGCCNLLFDVQCSKNGFDRSIYVPAIFDDRCRNCYYKELYSENR